METHTKTGEPRFCFYDPSLKLFFSTKEPAGVKDFQLATIWKESKGQPVLHWILEPDNDSRTWEEALREKYNILPCFKKITVSVQYKVIGL